MCPLEACILQVNNSLFCYPKEVQNHIHGHLRFPPGRMTCYSGHRGYTPTLYEKCHGIFNDHRELGPRFNVTSERHLCLLFSFYSFQLTKAKKTCNTSLILFFYFFYYIIKKQKPCYLYYVRLTETCYSSCNLLLFCWF